MLFIYVIRIADFISKKLVVVSVTSLPHRSMWGYFNYRDEFCIIFFFNCGRYRHLRAMTLWSGVAISVFST